MESALFLSAERTKAEKARDIEEPIFFAHVELSVK